MSTKPSIEMIMYLQRPFGALKQSQSNVETQSPFCTQHSEIPSRIYPRGVAVGQKSGRHSRDHGPPISGT